MYKLYEINTVLYIYTHKTIIRCINPYINARKCRQWKYILTVSNSFL